MCACLWRYHDLNTSVGGFFEEKTYIGYISTTLHIVRCYTTEVKIRCVNLTSIDANSVVSWPNPMFDHLLESCWWDDSNKSSNIEFGEIIDMIKIKIHILSGALFYQELSDQGLCQLWCDQL